MGMVESNLFKHTLEFKVTEIKFNCENKNSMGSTRFLV